MVDFKNIVIGQFAEQSGGSALSDLTDFRTVWYGQIVNGKLQPVFKLKSKQNPKYDTVKSFPFEGETVKSNVTAKHMDSAPKPSGLLYDGKYLSPAEPALLAKSLGDDLANYVVDSSELPAESVVHSKATIVAIPIICNRDERNFTVVIDSAVEVVKLGTAYADFNGVRYTSLEEINSSKLSATDKKKALNLLAKATVK